MKRAVPATALLLAGLLAAGLGPRSAHAADEAIVSRQAALGGLALVVAASRLDASIAASAERHRDDDLARAIRAGGDALPFAAFAYAGWQGWLTDGTDAASARTGREAVVAGLWAVAITQGTKLALARARPSSGLGPGHFDRAPRADSSFPSMHTALTWAVLSRYAESADAPSLYAVAALTNAARVLGRKHWLSDTVGGALLGGVLGHQGERLRPHFGLAGSGSELRWWVGPRSVALRVRF